MRNLFDQYEGLENRLTHALACCLAEDHELLRRFVAWATGGTTGSPARLQVIEQSLPGDPEVDEQESEARGLPDACIHDGSQWCLIIESKLESRLTAAQLGRHRRALERRGFSEIAILAITARDERLRLGEHTYHKRWEQLYQWCQRPVQWSPWAQRLAGYLEALEAKMGSTGKLADAKLTTFSGIPFGPDHPYNYLEARRVLSLAMEELRQRRDLRDELHVLPGAQSRPAITGQRGRAVWDVLRLSETKGIENFNQCPHLTLAISEDDVLALVGFPHGMRGEFRRRLQALGPDGFSDAVDAIAQHMAKSLAGAQGSAPWAQVLQRRYPSRSSQPIVDARVEFDMRSASLSGRRAPGSVRPQPVWVESAFQAFDRRRGANIHLGIGARFAYDHCPWLESPTRSLDSIAAAWIACKGLLAIAFGRERG